MLIIDKCACMLSEVSVRCNEFYANVNMHRPSKPKSGVCNIPPFWCYIAFLSVRDGLRQIMSCKCRCSAYCVRLDAGLVRPR